MKKLLLCTLVVLAAVCLSAQTTTLSKPYSRSLNAATTTGDGLVFVAPLEGGTTPAQWTMTTAVTGFSAIQIQLLGSINNSNWFVLATSTSTAGESIPAAQVATYVKCTIVSKTGTGTATCDIASSSAPFAYPGVPSCGVGCIAPDTVKVGATLTAGTSVGAAGGYDYSNATATNAATYLATPVPYYGTEMVHPDVIYFAAGWNGHKYWMTGTPYPNNGSAYENPSVYYSDDGQTWAAPAGLTNPVIPTPGDGGYNSDPDLVDMLDGSVCLFARQFNSAAGGSTKIVVTCSSNATTWTPLATSLSLTGTTSGGAGEAAVSPSLLYDGATLTMYTVNTTDANAANWRISKRTSADRAVTWSAPVVVAGLARSTAPTFWHMNADVINGQVVLLLMLRTDNSAGGQLWLAWSQDGLTGSAFTLAPQALLAGSVSGWDQYIYRSTFLPIANNKLAIWYSATTSTANGATAWHIGYTEASVPVNSVTATPTALTINGDTQLTRDGANALALKNGAKAQNLNVYNTVDTAGNSEYASVGFVANGFVIGPAVTGSGTLRTTRINGSNVGFQSNGSTRWLVDGSGNLTPFASNAYDAGSHSLPLRHIYAGDGVGTATLSTGSATVTFSAAYSTSAPVCVCTDTTAVNAVKCSTTTTALTISGTGSDVIAYACYGK